MKRIFVLALIIVLLVSVLFMGLSCKAETASAEETEAEPAEETEAEPAEETEAEPIELSWIQWWETEIGVELLDSIEAKFIEEHPGVTISREDVPYDQNYSKIILLAKAGQLPDIVGADTYYLPSVDKLGGFENLDPYIDRDNLRDDLLALGKLKGKTMQILIYGGALCIFVNKEKFEEKGLEYPTTWDEYLNVSRELTDPANNEYAMAAEFVNWAGAYYWFYPTLVQAGGKIIDDEGNLLINSPEGVVALEFIKQLYDEGLFLPGTLSNSEKEKREAFTGGVTAMMNDGPWGIGIFDGMDIQIDYDVILQPKGPANSGAISGGSGVAMSSTSKNKDMAWEFMKFLFAGEGNRMWNETVKNISCYKPNLEMSYIKEDPRLQSLATQTANPANITDVAIDMIFYDVLIAEIQKFLVGEKSAQEALDDTITNYEEALKRGE